MLASLASALLLTLGAPQPVLLWHSYRADEAATLQRLVDQFNQSQQDYHLDAVAIPYDAMASKVSAAIPRGQGPDLFIFAHERLGGWAEAKLLAPVPLDSSRFVEGTAEALQWKGQQLGAPLDFKTVALFYNRKLLATPPRSTDDLLALGARFAQPEAGRYALAYQSSDFYYHAPWYFGFGGTLFDANGQLRVESQPAAASLRFVAELQAHGLVPPEPTSALVSQLFAEGKVPLAINGPWFVGEFPAGLDYGIAPLPVVSATGLPARPFLTVEGLFVSAHARSAAGARAALSFLTSDASALLRATQARQLVANRESYTHAEVQKDPVLTAFRAQAQLATPMSSAPQMELVWEPSKRALGAVLRGDDPEVSVAAEQRQLQALARPAPPVASPWATVALALVLLGGLGFWLWRRRGPAEQGGSTAYLYVLPAGLATLVLVAIPIGFSFGLAFLHHRIDGSYGFVGLGNFANILSSHDYAITEPLSFYFTLGVTLLWTVVNLAFHVGLGVGLALLLRAPWLRLKPVFRILLIIPWAVPNYLTALIWKAMFHRQFGAINALLGLVGVAPVSWFSHFATAFSANVATNVWLGFPFMMVVTLGALAAIPTELYDAAALDGAGAWQRFVHVTVPQLLPTLLPAVVLGGVWTFNMFNVVWLVSGGEPGGSTDILISEAYRWAFSRQAQYGYAAAYSTLIFVLLAGYSMASQRWVAKRRVGV